jgi:hypothetical protein
MARLHFFVNGIVGLALLGGAVGSDQKPNPGPPSFPFLLEKGKLYHGLFAGNEDRPELFNPVFLHGGMMPFRNTTATTSPRDL